MSRAAAAPGRPGLRHCAAGHQVARGDPTTTCLGSRRGGRPLSLRCIVTGRTRWRNPRPARSCFRTCSSTSCSPSCRARLQAVLATRDRMRGLLEAVVAIGSGLDLESTLRRIVEAAVGLVDATYGALGVIGDDDGGKLRLAEFIPVGLSQDEIARIHHWPEGRGLLGLLIDDSRPLRLADISSHPASSGFPDGHPPDAQLPRRAGAGPRRGVRQPVPDRQARRRRVHRGRRGGPGRPGRRGRRGRGERPAVRRGPPPAALDPGQRRGYHPAAVRLRARRGAGRRHPAGARALRRRPLRPRAARRGRTEADRHLRRRRRRGRGPRPGAADRPVPVRPGAGHRRAGDVGRLRRRRARLRGRPRRDEPDRARGGVPARRAGQRPRRAHRRPPSRRGAVPPGSGRRGGLVRGPGGRRARARREPGRGRTAVGPRGQGPDRP